MGPRTKRSDGGPAVRRSPVLLCRDGAAFGKIREKTRSTGPNPGQLARLVRQLAGIPSTARGQLAAWVSVQWVNWLSRDQLAGWWDDCTMWPIPPDRRRAGSTGPHPPGPGGSTGRSSLRRQASPGQLAYSLVQGQLVLTSLHG